MVEEAYGLYDVHVKKIGRKWIAIDGLCSKNQVLICDITKDFEIGKTYEIYAKCITDKTRYGTTKSYYPMLKEECIDFIRERRLNRFHNELNRYSGFRKRHSDTKDKIMNIINDEVLADYKEELLHELKEVEKDLKFKEYQSNGTYMMEKFRRIKNYKYSEWARIELIINLIVDYDNTMSILKEKDIDFFNEIMQDAFDICESITLECDDCTDMFYCIRKMKKFFINDGTYGCDCYKEVIDNITKDTIQKGENLINEKLDEIEESIAANIEEVPLLTDCRIYRCMKDKGYLEGSIKVRIEEVENKITQHREKLKLEREKARKEREKAEKEKVDAYKKDKRYDYLVNNVFELKDKKAFTTTLIANGVGLEDSEKLFEKSKYIDDNVYILTFRLGRELFKEAIDNLIKPIDTGNRVREYISKRPYDLIEMLLEKNVISIDVINEEDDTQKIKLWSNDITEPFEYRKEEVYGETYYFVTKEMTSVYRVDGTYNAYYIVGWDKDNNSGFSHRIPWKEDVYENMSVKEIVDYIFMYNYGYKRIQGDILVKEFETKEVIENITYTTRTVKVNEKVRENTYKEVDSDYYLKMVKDQVDNPIKKDEKKIYRKNLYVVGDCLKVDNEIFTNCKVFCNDREIFSSDTPIEFNTYERGERLKYSLYYQPVTYELSYEVKHAERIKTVSVDSNGLEDYDTTRYLEKMKNREIESEQYYIGEHKVNCKALYAGISFERGSDGVEHVDKIYCIGKFTISHGQHTFVEYGQEDKVYELRAAIRHRKKRLYID